MSTFKRIRLFSALVFGIGFIFIMCAGDSDAHDYAKSPESCTEFVHLSDDHHTWMFETLTELLRGAGDGISTAVNFSRQQALAFQGCLTDSRNVDMLIGYTLTGCDAGAVYYEVFSTEASSLANYCIEAVINDSTVSEADLPIQRTNFTGFFSN